MKKPHVVAVVGPTASGKTALAIEIARRYNGEVISVDSRQVYRGLDIGSGKVTPAEMQGVPHHLIDIVDPKGLYTAADFIRDATRATEDILARGRVPIIAGGTFFYLDLLRHRVSVAPVPPNPSLRTHLAALPTETLYRLLQQKDPNRAVIIDKQNRHRLIRALEVASALGSVPPVAYTPSLYQWLMLGISLSKEQVKENIKKRLDERLAAGMVEEVKRLHESGVSWERLERFGLEYRYISLFLQGKMNEGDMRTALTIKIGQFAKRQRTWLRRYADIVWFTPEERDALFQRLEKFLC